MNYAERVVQCRDPLAFYRLGLRDDDDPGVLHDETGNWDGFYSDGSLFVGTNGSIDIVEGLDVCGADESADTAKGFHGNFYPPSNGLAPDSLNPLANTPRKGSKHPAAHSYDYRAAAFLGGTCGRRVA